MASAYANIAGDGRAAEQLPAYARMLSAYHRSRAAELRAIVAALPLTRDSCVLDVACGDGCYTRWLAAHARQVIGVDISAAYLDLAVRRDPRAADDARISLGRSDAARLPFRDASFDLVWCAQSFFSLPDPLTALREMIRVARPAGYVAILENDTLHQVLVPWPATLELAVRQAQLQALAAKHPARELDKSYIGRNLGGLLRSCGITRWDLRTLPVERYAPLSADEEEFLSLYFADLREHAWPYLDPPARSAFDQLFDSSSASYMLRRPDFHLTHLEMLVIGQRPPAQRSKAT
jgi:ubiquinone/menaquinone biosynthesis C-methylase UbiE